MLQLFIDGTLFYCANVSEVMGVLIAHEGLGKGGDRATVTLRLRNDEWHTFASDVYDVRVSIENEWGRG